MLQSSCALQQPRIEKRQKIKILCKDDRFPVFTQVTFPLGGSPIIPPRLSSLALLLILAPRNSSSSGLVSGIYSTDSIHHRKPKETRFLRDSHRLSDCVSFPFSFFPLPVNRFYLTLVFIFVGEGSRKKWHILCFCLGVFVSHREEAAHF